MNELLQHSAPLWQPAADNVASARVTAFIAELHSRGVLPAHVHDMHTLQRWSVDNVESFWAEIWRAAAVIATPRADGTLWANTLVGAERMAPPDAELGPRWFTDARINFAENLLRRRDDELALVAWSERGRERVLTFAELSIDVARAGAALRALGVKPGDRVAGFLPNIPEAVVAMLAAASIGAIWSSCSPDFGAKGVLDRFGQIEPVVLIAVDGYRYASKIIDCRERIAQVAASIPSLRGVWMVGNLETRPDISTIVHASHYHEMLAQYADVTEPEFTRLPFDHPLCILYSSGTTGLPKCMVHGAGGTLLQHWKEHALHTNIDAGDVVFYFTTCGLDDVELAGVGVDARCDAGSVRWRATFSRR